VSHQCWSSSKAAVGYDAPGALAPFVALLRAATSNEQAATMLRQFVTTKVLGRIAAAAAPDQPELHAALAGSHVIGLAMARYIVRIPNWRAPPARTRRPRRSRHPELPHRPTPPITTRLTDSAKTTTKPPTPINNKQPR
jgi:hypothetical protein